MTSVQPVNKDNKFHLLKNLKLDPKLKSVLYVIIIKIRKVTQIYSKVILMTIISKRNYFNFKNNF